MNNADDNNYDDDLLFDQSVSAQDIGPNNLE
jgi:hypothetical protein